MNTTLTTHHYQFISVFSRPIYRYVAFAFNWPTEWLIKTLGMRCEPRATHKHTLSFSLCVRDYSVSVVGVVCVSVCVCFTRRKPLFVDLRCFCLIFYLWALCVATLQVSLPPVRRVEILCDYVTHNKTNFFGPILYYQQQSFHFLCWFFFGFGSFVYICAVLVENNHRVKIARGE